MISNFTLKGNKIILKNRGEYFGALGDFEYNIGDKLYEFAIMSQQDFDKLKDMYNQLIELVCYAKETDSEEEKLARNDQKYCNNLYLDTGKTCREIGATNKHKEKVENSDILKEYKKEYKKIYGRHYKHPKEFTEKKFKQWSKKAIELRDSYNDSQIEEFKIELKKLSQSYCKK